MPTRMSAREPMTGQRASGGSQHVFRVDRFRVPAHARAAFLAEIRADRRWTTT